MLGYSIILYSAWLVKNYIIDLYNWIEFVYFIYFMKPEWAAIKEKMFCILSVIGLFTAK